MNHELSATSIVSLFEMTKTERSSFITRVVDAMKDGNADPLKVHLQVKTMEKIIEGLTSTSEKDNKDNFEQAKVYRGLVLSAAEQYGKEFDYHNAKMKISEVGVKYDYSQCNDPEQERLASELKSIGDQLKARQAFLQTVKQGGMEILVGDELVTVYPPAKSSTTNVNVSLK